MIWFILKCKLIFDKYSEDEMSVYAAQASFFIILAAFPFLMLLLALINVIPMVHEADLLEFLVEAVPSNLAGLVIYIVDSLYTDSSVTLLSATAIAALWSASRGMLSIERGLNRVCGVDVQRGYLIRRLISAGYTVGFSLMCVVCLVLLVFGSSLQEKLLLWFPQLNRLSFLFSPGRTLVSMTVLFGFFLAIYTALPFKRMQLRHQIPGAVFSAVGWTLFSMAFSLYFKHFGHFTVTYGSLTAVILMMLWLYFCICILFAGAELNWFFFREKGLSLE